MNQVGIVGGGKGGASLLSCMLQTPGIKVLGIADTNLGSPGIQLAKAHGIFTTTDFRDLLALPGKKTIIDATGVPEVARALKEMDGDNLQVVSPEVAELLWTIIEDRESTNRVLMQESSSLLSFIQTGIVQLEEMNDESEAALGAAAHRIQSLAELTANSHELLQHTEAIIKIVRNVADKSRILGINAAIESARAGEQGRGFGVVADAIHELAAHSVESVQSVTGTIKEIYTTLASIREQVEIALQDIHRLEEKQSALTQELHAAFEEMGTSAENLRKLSEAKK
ncbi:MAG: hypothetical protein AA931_06600 [Peptococcaceae bacterium 1109]|nr:MAG: hypothetical protein AA931_06600 [Peptococcaceae bacterium 1109]